MLQDYGNITEYSLDYWSSGWFSMLQGTDAPLSALISMRGAEALATVTYLRLRRRTIAYWLSGWQARGVGKQSANQSTLSTLNHRW
jgi:hypothetical protein